MRADVVLKEARRSAGLTQREVAARAGVPQSTVARIESRALSPRVETLDRLLESLGFEIDLRPVPGRDVDRSLIRRMLQLTPTERVDYVVAGGETIGRLQDAVDRSRR